LTAIRDAHGIYARHVSTLIIRNIDGLGDLLMQTMGIFPACIVQNPNLNYPLTIATSHIHVMVRVAMIQLGQLLQHKANFLQRRQNLFATANRR